MPSPAQDGCGGASQRPRRPDRCHITGGENDAQRVRSPPKVISEGKEELGLGTRLSAPCPACVLDPTLP